MDDRAALDIAWPDERRPRAKADLFDTMDTVRMPRTPKQPKQAEPLPEPKPVDELFAELHQAALARIMKHSKISRSSTSTASSAESESEASSDESGGLFDSLIPAYERRKRKADSESIDESSRPERNKINTKSWMSRLSHTLDKLQSVISARTMIAITTAWRRVT